MTSPYLGRHRRAAWTLDVGTQPTFQVAAIPTRGCKEPAWHRNLRKQRQQARGLIAACKTGFEIPDHLIESAYLVLAPHHATDPHTMSSWEYQQIMKMQQQLSDMMGGKGGGHQAAKGGKAKGKGSKGGGSREQREPVHRAQQAENISQWLLADLQS